MTNEEKTNEYIENLLCKNFDNDGTSLYTEDEIKKAILYGLAEGEKIGKEKQWVASEKAQKKTSKRIRELQKENAELNAKLNHTHCVECASEYLKEIGTLKEQVEKIGG